MNRLTLKKTGALYGRWTFNSKDYVVAFIGVTPHRKIGLGFGQSTRADHSQYTTLAIHQVAGTPWQLVERGGRVA